MTELDLSQKQLAGRRRSSDAGHFAVSTIYHQWISRTNIWHPPTDVYETEAAIVVQIEIAGMKDAEFTISLEKDVLVVQGMRNHGSDQRAYYRMEINSGEFLSVVELSEPIDYDRIEANYNDGFLMIVAPKKPPSNVDIK